MEIAGNPAGAASKTWNAASLYEIEMPVIYSLYHMEEEGIQVRRGIKVYGERLPDAGRETGAGDLRRDGL
ncbi:MAG: hypothetical protein ACLR8P_14150 [Clostridium fessum]